jgi:hypothetical protein
LKILAEKYLNIKIQRNNKNHTKIIKKDESIEIISSIDNKIEVTDVDKGSAYMYIFIYEFTYICIF